MIPTVKKAAFHLFFVFVFIFVCFCFMETSPFPGKGCNFLPMLGTGDYLAVRVLLRATPTVTRDIRL